MAEQPEQDEQRRKPRVVDKRVSARGADQAEAGTAEQTPPVTPDASPAPDPQPEHAPEADAGNSGEATAREAAAPEAAAPEATAAQETGTSPFGPGPEEVWTPEQEAEARAVAEQILRTPSAQWVVNSAVSLANIAATKLDLGHPADAQMAIDALAGILKEVGHQLGEVEQPLRQTLAQLQMAYAERVAAPPGNQP